MKRKEYDAMVERVELVASRIRTGSGRPFPLSPVRVAARWSLGEVEVSVPLSEAPAVGTVLRVTVEEVDET